LGAEVLVLSTSGTPALRKLVADEGLELTFLVDPEAEVIDRYGLRNPDHPASFGVAPHPAALVIDRDGVIRYKRVDVDYKVRPTAAELVEAVRGLAKEE
jgi:peroxiredoxin